jgi:predicted kinase
VARSPSKSRDPRRSTASIDGPGSGNSASPGLIMMRGHTASGKTTLSRWLAANTAAIHISQSARKRALVTEYSAADSLREDLRERGYEAALADALECIRAGSTPIIDASYHKLARRRRVYEGAAAVGAFVILIDCFCPSTDEVSRRIAARRGVPKTADNQADSMQIYHHILGTEDPFSEGEVPGCVPTGFIRINTSANLIEAHACESGSAQLRQTFSALKIKIREYLEGF